VALHPGRQPAGRAALIAPRRAEHEYDVDHRGDLFYIRTNKGCRNFRVVTRRSRAPGPENWKELFPCREDVMVESIDLFAGLAVFYEREDALPAHPRHRLSRRRALVPDRLPEAIYSAGLLGNLEFDTRMLRIEFESFTTPPSVYDFDMVTRERKLLKRKEVLGGYDRDCTPPERQVRDGPGWRARTDLVVYRRG
jgi:oligopeptidase B